MNNQMNSAVRKIHNLLSSRAVTVTGPNQPRILKHKIVGSGSGGMSSTNTSVSGGNNALSSNNHHCYVCDDILGPNQAQHQLTEMQASHTGTKFPNKIGQLIGDAYMVVVSVEDVVCGRCTNLLNYLDRLENDAERVRSNLLNLLQKKYGILDDILTGGNSTVVPPPNKMQKLNTGTSVSTVQQVKIPPTTLPTVPQPSTATQTIQRKTTRIYKCLSCDYKTSDMRLFNTHYETCKQQNFQCKNCKKIFPNFGIMKQHMIREHNTPMDNTCAVCHINFASETSLRKHMELNHSTNVVVTSTTTVPVGQAAAAAADHISSAGICSNVNNNALYACNQCQFKCTDKALFDEHMRKHVGSKSKPFKCRLCAQRFETRDAATIHAKQHQSSVFKCGTCSMSFPKRELLVKHFEVHQHPTQVQTSHQTTQPQVVTMKQINQQPVSQNVVTTQKLLQETIDEALSESTTHTPIANMASDNATNNIRFLSCHLCSLTFIQENYYNRHMESHRRGETPIKKTSNNSGAITALLGESQQVETNETHSIELAKRQQHVAELSNSTSNATISETDIESIFEKMHSDKRETADPTATSSSVSNGGDQVVITSQAGSGGDITFNITIPAQESRASSDHQDYKVTTASTTTTAISKSMDMPMLDHPDETIHTSNAVNRTGTKYRNVTSEVNKSVTGPVSMPSLDDDNEVTNQSAGLTATSSATINDAGKSGERTTSENNCVILRKEEIKTELPNESEHPNDIGLSRETEINSVTSEHHGGHTADDSAIGRENSEGATHAVGEQQQQVALELDEATMQAQVDGGQIKFILNENGQLLQLDNHIITDADGNQILVQDPEQIQQLLQSVGVLQSGEGLDGETIQMMTDANGQMVLVHGENNDAQLIDASLLNAEGQLVIQQSQDGEGGAHVIGEDGTRIPVSVSYTEDGQPIVQVQQQVLEAAASAESIMDKDTLGANASTHINEPGRQHVVTTTSASGSTFLGLEELMQSSSQSVTTTVAVTEVKSNN